MKTVYILQYLHLLPDDIEDVKIIGIYNSREKAVDAINRLKGQSGFSDHPKLINPSIDDEAEGFYIGEYKLNEDHWVDGFVTV